ncbi:hypothetical protein OA88_22690 [Flavobacterium sp. JRM]|nr:hypothetical protein OA88_22690 [Flavobacterium sp. JRM]
MIGQQHLFTGRVTFIQKATLPVMEQMLQDLLRFEVINPCEAEAIWEENATRSDKARALIDTVRRKGDIASCLFAGSVVSSDLELAKEMGVY